MTLVRLIEAKGGIRQQTPDCYGRTDGRIVQRQMLGPACDAFAAALTFKCLQARLASEISNLAEFCRTAWWLFLSMESQVFSWKDESEGEKWVGGNVLHQM